MKLELKKASELKVGDILLISHNCTVLYSHSIVAVKIDNVKHIPEKKGVFGNKAKTFASYVPENSSPTDDWFLSDTLVPVVQE